MSTNKKPQLPVVARRGAVLEFAPSLDPGLRAALGYTTAADALLDPRGWTVRCTPRCRTTMFRVGGRLLFRKLHAGRSAAREWLWLHRLAAHGFAVPGPVCLGLLGQRSVVVSDAAPGRPLDALLRAAVYDRQRAAAAEGYAQTTVAPFVRRLHQAGWFHRDLYWNHLFAVELSPGAGLTMLDVERLLAPRCRRQRWVVKDLASLLASLPDGFRATAVLRFLHAYLGNLDPGWKALARAVVRKARRVRAHQPKFGGIGIDRAATLTGAGSDGICC